MMIDNDDLFKAEMHRQNVYFPEDILKKLRRLSKRQGRTLSAQIVHCCRLELDRDECREVMPRTPSKVLSKR